MNEYQAEQCQFIQKEQICLMTRIDEKIFNGENKEALKLNATASNSMNNKFHKERERVYCHAFRVDAGQRKDSGTARPTLAKKAKLNRSRYKVKFKIADFLKWGKEEWNFLNLTL
jgi:hypothetical protein